MLNLNLNIIYTFVNLIILYLLLRKFLFGPVTAIMDKRANEIKNSLDDAKSAKQEAAALKSSYIAKLNEAENAAKVIVKEAREAANTEREKIITKAKNEAGSIMQNASRQIELEKERSLKNVRSEIAGIAMDAAVKAAKSGNISESSIDGFINDISISREA